MKDELYTDKNIQGIFEKHTGVSSGEPYHDANDNECVYTPAFSLDWTKDDDLLETIKHKTLNDDCKTYVPIHLGQTNEHWVILEIDPQNKRANIADSLGEGSFEGYKDKIEELTQKLLPGSQMEVVCTTPDKIQHDSHSCGPFICEVFKNGMDNIDNKFTEENFISKIENAAEKHQEVICLQNAKEYYGKDGNAQNAETTLDINDFIEYLLIYGKDENLVDKALSMEQGELKKLIKDSGDSLKGLSLEEADSKDKLGSEVNSWLKSKEKDEREI